MLHHLRMKIALFAVAAIFTLPVSPATSDEVKFQRYVYHFNPVMNAKDLLDVAQECWGDQFCNTAVKGFLVSQGVPPKTLAAVDVFMQTPNAKLADSPVGEFILRELSGKTEGGDPQSDQLRVYLRPPEGFMFCRARARRLSTSPGDDKYRTSRFRMGMNKRLVMLYGKTPRQRLAGPRSWIDLLLEFEVISREHHSDYFAKGRCRIDNGAGTISRQDWKYYFECNSDGGGRNVDKECDRRRIEAAIWTVKEE